MRAAGEGHAGAIEMLLRGDAKLDTTDKTGSTALHKAVPTGDVELLRLLLQHNAIVDHTTIDGIRAVGVAVKLGKSEMVRMLSEAGADLAMLNPKDGSLLLHEACWAGHLEMVEELLVTRAQDSNLSQPEPKPRGAPFAWTLCRKAGTRGVG